MRRCLLIVLVGAACGGPSTRDDCVSYHDAFLRAVRTELAEVAERASPDHRADARALLDRIADRADGRYLGACRTISDEDWACVRARLHDPQVSPACEAAATRFMDDVVDLGHPPTR